MEAKIGDLVWDMRKDNERIFVKTSDGFCYFNEITLPGMGKMKANQFV